MIITSVEAVRVRSTPSQKRASALGGAQDFDYGIVFLRTDNGLEGLGEISMLWDGQGGRGCYDVNEILAPVVVGQSAFDLTKILARMDRAIQFSPASNTAKAGIEMALWDLLGKHFDTPLYNLLGGKMRDSLPLSVSVYIDAPEVMAEKAKSWVDRGFGTIKIKIGLDPAHDVAALAAIREAVGESVNIRVDANMAWRSPAEAVAAIRALERFDIHSIEQPMAPDKLSDMALLRGRVATPIMLDESLWGPEDAVRALRADAADIFNVYVSEAGGISRAARIFAMASAFGVDATIGSMPELGIGTAAQVHLGLTVDRFDVPGDVCGSLYHARDVITAPLPLRDGRAFAPEGPGLGVTLDQDAFRDLAKAAQQN